MDTILCDELLQEIFNRVPPTHSSSSSSSSSSSAVSLVSKRWLHLFRSSTTSLSLHFTTTPPPTILSLSSFLSHHPFLSSLSLTTTTFSDQFLLSISSSCPNLKTLRLLSPTPLSLFSLLSLSSSCPHLSFLTITLSIPFTFHWLIHFLSLKHLSIFFSGTTSDDHVFAGASSCTGQKISAELQIESLSLSGIWADVCGLNWLWKSLKKLKKLQLNSCQSVGDNGSFSDFAECLKGVEQVELRTCRTIVDGVLLKLAENCLSLNSLLVYDGGSREGLLQFINQSQCNLQKLDFRLPLDLDNNHLVAIAENFRGLLSLRLQSCCLITGEGLKTLGRATSNGLEELALLNCEVVEREPGLLATLGQNLRQLKKLDLSYNEMLVDKELTSMLVSCSCLNEVKLRGCNGLTNAALVSMSKNCKQLQCVDIMYCRQIDAKAIELFILNSPMLKRVQVEQRKLSDAASAWALNKVIEVV